MDALIFEPGNKTPYIHLNSTEGKMEITGISMSENSRDFYEPVIDWIKKYAQNPTQPTTVNFKLKYFNTNSAKCILDILEELKIIQDKGNKLHIEWFYEDGDEEMQEAGENYSEILDLPMQLTKAAF